MDHSGARRLAVGIAAAVALALASACGGDEAEADCPACAPASACGPPFSLAVVVEPPRQPISGAVATSPGLTCSGGNASGIAQCAAGTAEATYDVEVSAPYFLPKRITVAVGPAPAPDACGCQTACQSWEPTLVVLERAP